MGGELSNCERLVLGVDPSLNRTGWAALAPRSPKSIVLIAAGVIAPPAGSRGERLLVIQNRLDEVLRAHNPAVAFFEAPGTWHRRGGIRRETLEAMGMARGVMLAACARSSVPTTEVDFHTVRLKLVGTRRSDQVTEYLSALGLTVPTRPRGAADLDIANAMLMAAYGLTYGRQMLTGQVGEPVD